MVVLMFGLPIGTIRLPCGPSTLCREEFTTVSVGP
nr:hypothetical protein CPGR_00381 [Mycolicibacter nonchromogenicus]